MPTGEYKRTATGRKHQSEAAKKRTPKGKEAQPGCKRNLIPAAMAKLMNMTPEQQETLRGELQILFPKLLAYADGTGMGGIMP